MIERSTPATSSGQPRLRLALSAEVTLWRCRVGQGFPYGRFRGCPLARHGPAEPPLPRGAGWALGFAPSPPPRGAGRARRRRCGWSGGRASPPDAPGSGDRRRSPCGTRDLVTTPRRSPPSWRLPPIPDPPDRTHSQRLRNSRHGDPPLSSRQQTAWRVGGGRGLSLACVVSFSRRPALRTQFWHRLPPWQTSPAHPGCTVPLRCGDT